MVKKSRHKLLKIITYNIYYGEKLSDIYSWINSLRKKPDIICFQEFPRDKIRSLKKLNFPFKTAYNFSSGLERQNKRFGQLTLYNSDKLGLTKRRSIKLGIDYLEKFYKKRPNKRTALLSVFKYRNSFFVLVNLHLSAISLNSKRREQVTTVLHHIETIPTIILGDFNYSSLLGRKGLINLMQGSGFSVAGEKMITNRYRKRIPQQLDYVFYKNFLLESIEVEKIEYSDHYPITVKMRPQSMT